MKAKMSKAPLVEEAKPHAKGAPMTMPPEQPTIKGVHQKSGKRTFTAPRSGGSSDPTKTGFTKA